MSKFKFGRSFEQICGLVNKYFIIRRRKYMQTSIELLLPIILVALIVYGSRNESKVVNPSYPSQPNPGDIIPLTFDSYVDFNSSFLKQLLVSPIYFIPDSHETREIMSAANEIIKSVDAKLCPQLIAEQNQTTLNSRWYKMSPLEQEISSGFINFKNVSGLTQVDGTFDLEIEQNGLKYPQLNSAWRSLTSSGPSYSRDYSTGFLQLQILVYQAYLSLRRVKLSENASLENVSNLHRFKTRRLPYPEHRVVGRSPILDQTPIAIAYGLSITFTYLVFRTSNERANSSIEMLLMCGMKRKIYWFTNFLSAYMIMAFISTLQLAVIFIFTDLYSNSSFLLILIQVHIYIIHLIVFGQLCTILFYRPIIVSIISLIIFILSFASVDNLLSNRDNRYLATERRIICFLPNSAIVLLFRILAQKEIRGFGSTWHNVAEPLAIFDHINCLEISILQVMWSTVYIILIWYLDRVWPIQSGIPQVWYFPLTSLMAKHQSAGTSLSGVSDPSSQFFEDESTDAKRVIECCNVTKSYNSSFSCTSDSLIAVDNLNLNVYSRSITCLLGHNGAGKTTTMNMITGMLLPDSGTIKINGINLLKDTRRAREKMSLCPQHNSLYDDLTVGEHLYFYAIIKGASSETVNNEIADTLKNLSLDLHVDKLSCELSGGMKRKLCLAISLIAGSTIIILDEPSAGLDTESRREMWDILKRIRSSRTILLTTHDMEEADALADRIIMMNKGRVVCNGSPMYLKKLFSPGYILHILKNVNYDHDAVVTLIKYWMPKAVTKLDSNSEIIFTLFDNHNENSTVMSQFFRQLEENKVNLGIHSFGVSVSMLEEVFSRAQSLPPLGSNNSVYLLDEFTSQDSLVDELAADSSEESVFHDNLLSGMKLLILQIYALIAKRVIDTCRNQLMVIFQLSIPPLVITCAFLITNSDVSFPLLSKSQHLSTSLYPSSRVFLQSDSHDPWMRSFEEYFERQIHSYDYEYDHLAANDNLTQYLVEQSLLMSPEKFSNKLVYGLSLQRDFDHNIVYESWINFQAYHSMPTILSMIGQIEDILVNGNNSIDWITISLLPAHDTDQLRSLPNMTMIWTMIISFSITFMCAFYIFHPTDEVSSKIKLIQLMTGLHPFVYYATSFIFDLTIHCLWTCVIMSVLYSLDTNSTVTSAPMHNLAAILTAFILLGAIVILINYTLSSVPSNATQGYLMMFIVFCVTGAMLTIIASTLEMYVKLNIISWKTFKILINIFRVSPTFTMSWLMKKLYQNGIQRNLCSTIQPNLLSSACEKQIYAHCCPETCYDTVNHVDTCLYPSPFGWADNQLNMEITMLASQLVATVIILFLKENYPRMMSSLRREKTWKVDSTDATIDLDVQNERNYVTNLVVARETATETLVVSDLCKDYGKFRAVNCISFTVGQNECFGLLGVNGAGKSSTFAMLTGDTTVTSGVVYQGFLDVYRNLRLYQRNIGYCPQVNPILTRLTGREMLILSARLRGVNTNHINRLIDRVIKLVNLGSSSDKLSGTYSGGNKRKLSIALAAIGQPKLIFLDEPTAGVDPIARRVLWSSLMSIRDSLNTSMILTSHCMEECETLCSRISIMMNGEFVCIGSPQQLKEKFGRGFTLIVRFKPRYSHLDDYITDFTNKLRQNLQYVELIDRCDVNLTYQIGKHAGQWSHLFATMEQLHTLYDLEDFLLTDTSLGQIFMHFSRLKNISSHNQ